MSTLYLILLLLLLILIPSLTYALLSLLKCAPPLAEPEPRRAGAPKPAPVSVVAAGAAREEECPVCLAALEEGGEELWRIDLCKHLFHGACVARWLRAHANCPVCRAYVEPAQAPKGLRLARADDVWQGMPDSAGLV